MTIRLSALLVAAVALASALRPADAGQKLMQPKIAGQEPPAIPIPEKPIGERKAIHRKAIVRRPGEGVEELASRILPPGASTLTKPLEMTFPPLGKVILILFETSPDAPGGQDSVDSIYSGWLLAPDGKPDRYRLEVLPPIPEGSGRLEYDILSVFTADADGDAEAAIRAPALSRRWPSPTLIPAHACGFERPSYNSCRNRHCPKCQALAQARWVEARLGRALFTSRG
jgi:Transposase zinc-binding domain